MSNYGRCNDCGATGGHHFNDCDYDGTGNRGTYHHSSSSSDLARSLVLVLAILFGIPCPPIGFLLMTLFMHM